MTVRRGFTIAETLVVAVILGLMLTAIVGSVAPLLSAPDRVQAKSDALTPATAGLYVLQRDIRESDANGVFVCGGMPITCGDGGVSQATSELAVATARESASLDAPFSLVGGTPDWQGFTVYWQPEPGIVYRTFVPESNMNQDSNDDTQRSALAPLAADAVTSALAEPAPPIAMRNVASLAVSIYMAAGIISIHIVGMGSAGGHGNTATFDTDVFTRN